MHFTLLPANPSTFSQTPPCQPGHHHSHRLWKPSYHSTSHSIKCKASAIGQQQTEEETERQPSATNANVLPASVKNEQQLDKLLTELADLREQQRLLGLDDDGEIEEEVEGEEGKDWVWWRADQSVIPGDKQTSSTGKVSNNGGDAGSHQKQQIEGQATSAQTQKQADKPTSPRIMQAKRRLRPDNQPANKSGLTIKH